MHLIMLFNLKSLENRRADVDLTNVMFQNRFCQLKIDGMFRINASKEYNQINDDPHHETCLLCIMSFYKLQLQPSRN